MGRGQGRMAAQVHLNLGREPAQVEMVRLLYQEGRLGQVHFPGNGLEPLVFSPSRQNAHGCRVPGKRSVGEGVNVEEGKAHRGIVRGFVVSSFPSIFAVGSSLNQKGLVAPRQARRWARYETTRLPSSLL